MKNFNSKFLSILLTLILIFSCFTIVINVAAEEIPIYYVDSSLSDYTYNTGLSPESALQSVDAAIKKANTEYPDAEIVYVRLVGKSAIDTSAEAHFWAGAANAATTLTNHTYTLNISSAEADKKAYIGGGYDLSLGGNTVFDNITIASRTVVDGTNTVNDKTFNFNNFDVSFSNTVVISHSNAYKYTINNGTTIDTDTDHTYYINTHMKAFIGLGGRNSSIRTFNNNLTFVVDNSAVAYDFRLGDISNNANHLTKYNKNLNFNVKSAKTFVIQKRGANTALEFGSSSAIQIINSSGVDLSTSIDNISAFINSNGVQVPYYILHNNTGMNNILEFTQTAGKYKVNLDSQSGELYIDGQLTEIDSEGCISVPEGEHVLTLSKKAVYYVDSLLSDYTNHTGLTEDDPLQSVNAAIIEAVKEYGAGDTVYIKLNGDITDAHLWDGTSHNNATLTPHSFKLNISSYGAAKAKIGSGYNLNLGGNTEFDNIIINTNGEGGTGNGDFFNLNNYDVSFTDNAEFVNNNYKFSVDNNNKTVTSDHTYKIDTSTKTFIGIGANYQNKIFDNNITFVLNPTTAISYDVRLGDISNNASYITTYNKNINFNLVSNSTLTLQKRGANTVLSFAPEAAIQIINSSGTSLSTSINNIATFINTENNQVPYYILYNETDIKDILEFTETAGKYKVNLDTSKYDILVDGEILEIEDDFVNITTGEHILTIEKKEIVNLPIIDKTLAGTSIFGSANLDSTEPGTPASAIKTNTTVVGPDGTDIQVAKINVGKSVNRYPSFNATGSTKFNIYPNSRIIVKYKYVKAENSTTTADISKLHPVITCTINGNSYAIISNDSIIENEWAEYSFNINARTTTYTEMSINQIRPIGIVTGYTSQEVTDNSLEFKGTFKDGGVTNPPHMDPNDNFYVAEMRAEHYNCTVTFDANGGENAPEQLESIGGLAVRLPEGGPIREGYNFLGWNSEKDVLNVFSSSLYYPMNNVVLYAIWEESGIVINSSVNGYTAVKGVTSNNGVTCGSLTKPGEIDGYNVAELHTKSDANSVFTADCWDLNLGFDSTVHTKSRIRITYKYIPAENTNTDLERLLAQKPSITFVSHTNSELGSLGTVTANNVIVKDKWVTAEFDLGGISALSGIITTEIKHIQMRLLSTYASGAPNNSTTNTWGSTPSIHVDPNDTLYIGEISVWNEYDYTVTFDANGGTGAPNPEYITSGFGIKLKATNPQRISYSFKGWGLTPNASEFINAGYIPTADTTLYAIWEENPDYSLGEGAVTEGNIGIRENISVGQSIYSDTSEVFSASIPDYLLGQEFLYTTKTNKNINIIDKGYLYILVPKDSEEEIALEDSGFMALGTLSEGIISESITCKYSIMVRYFTEKTTNPISCSAEAIVVGNIVSKDDSLIAGEVITFPAQKLEEHPEYAEYLNGNRNFGGCPAITETPDGRMWLSATSGGKEEDMYNYAMLYCSTDRGENWGEPVLVVNPDTPVRTSEPMVWCDPDGKLWFFWSQMYTPTAPQPNSDGRMGLWCMSSSDGENWTEPKRIFDGFCNQNPIVLSDGTWMMPINIWNNNNSYPELNYLKSPAVIVSTDKGSSWSFKGRVTDASDSWFYENAVIELPGNEPGTTKLWMTWRTMSVGVEQAFSYDGGATWTAAEDAGISLTSGRTAVDKLPNGDIIVISHNSELAGNKRTHLTVWLSKDNAETFPYKLQLDDTGWYPNTKVCSDGSIYITYDRKRSEGGCAVVSRITAADIIAGKLIDENSFLRALAFKGNNDIVDKTIISFDTNGGNNISDLTFTASNTTNGTETPTPFTVRALPVAHKQGFIFIGWATTENGEAILKAGENYTPAVSETLYAVYREVYTENFNDKLTEDLTEWVLNDSTVSNGKLNLKNYIFNDLMNSKNQYISVDLKGSNLINGFEIRARISGDEYYSFNISNNTLKLIKSGSIITSKDFNFDSNKLYRVSLSVVDSTLTAYIHDYTDNSILINLSYTDDNALTGTRFGFATNDEAVSLDSIYFSAKEFKPNDTGWFENDINGDGEFDIRDLVYAYEHKETTEDDVTARADKDNDKSVTEVDVAWIRKYVLGILS